MIILSVFFSLTVRVLIWLLTAEAMQLQDTNNNYNY